MLVDEEMISLQHLHLADCLSSRSHQGSSSWLGLFHPHSTQHRHRDIAVAHRERRCTYYTMRSQL